MHISFAALMLLLQPFIIDDAWNVSAHEYACTYDFFLFSY
jgi:hypothetical protein